jgi:Domain of unknown function (DUF4280)
MPIAVVQGAVLRCTCGDKPSQLHVTSQRDVKIDGKLAATVQDNAPGSNLAPFGTCKILTAAASGVPTPCVPAPAGPWLPGWTSRVNIGKHPALPSSHILNCTVPGVISITDPGQRQTKDS